MYRPNDSEPLIPASLWRRLAALVYDSLLILALVCLATLVILPFSGGEALDQSSLSFQLFRVYILCVVILYFSLFWSRGQTLGMRSWRLYLLTDSGAHISFGRAALRILLASILPLIGYLSVFWTEDKKSIPDLVLKTKMVVLNK
jgi:uncharacterized RDD family membrane protein YckC